MRRKRLGKEFFGQKYSDDHHDELAQEFMVLMNVEYVVALCTYVRNEKYFVSILGGQNVWTYPEIEGVL